MKDRLLPFGLSFTITCVFFLNVCAWLFECGCRSPWAGADEMCNVHLANSRHCPFCAHGSGGYAAVMTLVSAPQLAVSAWTRWGRGVRIALCLALFPVMMVAVGLLAGAVDGYW